MIKNGIFLKTAFSYAPLALLPTASAITPLAVIAGRNETTVEQNYKRTFNADEESGLNYNTTGGFNPFLSLDGTSTTYNLENLFYTKKNHLSHNNYQSFEWSNLSPSGPTSEISLWLAQLTNYLEDPNDKYPIQITNTKPPESGNKDDFEFNYDFSCNQSSEMKINWRTQQMGFGVQDSLAAFVNDSNSLVFPQYIQQDKSFPCDQYLWKSLTGSSFYTNYTDVKDPEKSHYPHEYKFNLKKPNKFQTDTFRTNPEIPTKITYKISFDAQGGSPTPATQEVEAYKKVSDPGSPSWEGHTFDGWFWGNLKWDFSENVVFGDITLKAHWHNNSTNEPVLCSNNNSTNDSVPNIQGKKIYFDFPSEYLPENKLASYSDVTSLSQLFSFVDAAGYSAPTDAIAIPAALPNTWWFGFDSKKEKSTDQGTWAVKGEEIFNELYPLFATGNDKEEIFDKMIRITGQSFNNILPTDDKMTTFAYYIPSFTTKDIYNKTATQKPIKIPLPKEETQQFPASTNDAYVNFMDYYNLDNQGSLSCDVKIKGDSNLLTYEFKSGGKTVAVKETNISPEFKQFFNMCLSSMQTDIHDAGRSVDNLKKQSTDGYLTLSSTGDNNIINLKSTLGSSSAIDTSVPFSQSFMENKGVANSISAQSLGWGFSTSNSLLEPISSLQSKTNTNYLTNLALVFNRVSLESTSDETSNKIMCNLDYLLAIDPTTTSIYNHSADGGATIPSVEIKLNPYYIQAAANAYNSYNFWLTFLSNNTANLSKIRGGQKTVMAAFRDLIMRGFIKSQKQAEQLVKNLQGKDIGLACPGDMTGRYESIKDPKYIKSYAALANPSANDFKYIPNDNFAWNVDWFNMPTTFKDSGKEYFIWPDENGNNIPYTPGVTRKISQGTWAPFCWQYGISPSTWSFLKSIPNDYTFEIPYGYVYPEANKDPADHPKNFQKGNLSGTKNIQTEKIKWVDLLHGKGVSLDFDTSKLAPEGGKIDHWNNVSVVIGTTNGGQVENQGIHSYLPEGSVEKSAITKEGATVKLSLPKFSSIKLATISNNNHINATTTNSTSPFDMNIIQQYSSKENRRRFIKSSKDINYVSADKTPSVLALHKSEKKLDLQFANNMSNNTYIVTKVNGNLIDPTAALDNYFIIDNDGTLGVELEVVKWRESLDQIHGKFYASANDSITGKYTDELLYEKWSMDAVAPEDWFRDEYKTTFNGYRTYKWAFHPSGLWSYKMQFYQDPDESAVEYGEDSWDNLHKKYDLDYSIWGHPTIEPITRTSYVPDRIINGHDEPDPQDPSHTIHVPGWKQKAQEAGINSPVFYTNNTTLELAFKVVYKDFAFTSSLFPGKNIVPIQYVYIPNLTYNFGMTKQKDQTATSVNSYSKLNNQYGDYAPSFLDRWTVDKTQKEEDAYYSTHDSYHLLDTNELINFYKSKSTNGLYRSNIYYNNFLQLYKNGWVYIEPLEISNEQHKLSFRIHYDSEVLVNQAFFAPGGAGTKLTEKNKDYIIRELPNKQQIKVPIIPGVNPDPTGEKTTSVKWYSTDVIVINDFRCVGTEWSTVGGKNRMTPFVIGLIVACCVTPLAIIGTGIGLHKIRTKVKKLK